MPVMMLEDSELVAKICSAAMSNTRAKNLTKKIFNATANMHADSEVDGHGTPWAYTASGHARFEAMEWGNIRVSVHNL